MRPNTEGWIEGWLLGNAKRALGSLSLDDLAAEFVNTQHLLLKGCQLLLLDLIFLILLKQFLLVEHQGKGYFLEHRLVLKDVVVDYLLYAWSVFGLLLKHLGYEVLEF